MSELIGYLSEVEQLNGELTIPKQLGGSTLGSKTITANGVYDATDDGVDGYDVVTANVPNTYTAGDEGKVVDNGALVSQTSATYTLNNTYDTTLINSVTVNVGGGSPTLETITKTYTPTTSQQAEQITPSSGYDGIAEVDVTVNAIPSQYIIPTGTKSISSNGTGIDVKAYEYADVAVPNSYSASDEGKVVDNGALVAQTAHADVTPTTSDQTIDTTLNNSLKVKGDADLVAGNIKKDVEIFGVTGTYEGGGISDIYDLQVPIGEIITSEQLIYSVGARTGITKVNAPNATKLYSTAFTGYTNLTDVSLPLANGDGYATALFRDCAKLKSVVMPSWNSRFHNEIFNRCSLLESVDLLGMNLAGTSVFANCPNFHILVLRGNTVSTLGGTNRFDGSPFASGGTGGTLYVPNSLISSYQSASNWSTILGYSTNSIKSIESTHTDPNAPIDLTLYYADGTPISA